MALYFTPNQNDLLQPASPSIDQVARDAARDGGGDATAAQAAADAAQADADAAQAAANTAQAAADAAQAAADAAQGDADGADADAATAQAAANAAQATANTALANAATAQTTANSGVANAAAAQATANTAVTNAATAQAAAVAAQSTANTALADAATAQAAANAAQATANTALANAATATTNAATAQSAANAAQSTANTAVTNAATAQTTANTGVTNAATAQTTANTGVTNAATAQTTANAALPKAGGAMTGAINEAQGANIASATTTDIGAATGDFVHITGTTTITGLGTVQAGTQRELTFDGVLTLTHNATSLILPGGASILTSAGDTGTFVSEGSGNWRCISWGRADGGDTPELGTYSSPGATLNMDGGRYTRFDCILNATTAIDLINPRIGKLYTAAFRSTSALAPRTVTWGANFVWSSASVMPVTVSGSNSPTLYFIYVVSSTKFLAFPMLPYINTAGGLVGFLVFSPGSTTYAATTNLNFLNTNDYQTLALTGDVIITTSNLASGGRRFVKILCDATIRNFTWPAWIWIGGTAPASIAANKTAILELVSWGLTDAAVTAQYSVQS